MALQIPSNRYPYLPTWYQGKMKWQDGEITLALLSHKVWIVDEMIETILDSGKYGIAYLDTLRYGKSPAK